MNENLRELIDDLLCKKVMYGLSAEEEKQLAELQREGGVDDESLSFELAAASVATGSLDRTEQMPAALRNRILADAEAHVGKPQPVADVPYYQNRVPILGWLGWAFAAAACVVLALNIYFTRTSPPVVVIPPTPTPSPEKTLTPGDMRQQLILSVGPDLARGTWQAVGAAGAQPTGDVVWDDKTQTGYVRLSGLPKNDPAAKTYQLWIVAENQDPKTPVDGGTFDITTDGEVIIPIDAKVKVQNPQAFAITLEKAGGVPVSKEKPVALAKRET